MGLLRGNLGSRDESYCGEFWSAILGLSLSCGSRTEMACGRLEVEPQMGRLGEI